MEYIWVVARKSGGACGENGRTEEAEKIFLDCERDLYKYHKNRKTYFLNRKDAEDYIRPIAKKAFDMMIEDMKDNDKDEDEDEESEQTKEYLKRGFQEIRREELLEANPFHELYHSSNPSTLFTCPSEDEYDRIGNYFAEVYKVNVY